MEPFQFHVFVCTQSKQEGVPSCHGKGAEEVIGELRKQIGMRQLGGSVQVTTCGCLGICEKGPNMIVYPEGIWYNQLTVEAVGRIVENHFVQNKPVTDLTIQDMDKTREEITEHMKKVMAMKAMMEKSGAVPDELNQKIRGFMESRIVLTAIELNLFSAVGSGSAATDVANRLDTNPRATEKLMNALTAVGLLTKSGDTFQNSPIAAKFLVEGSEFDSRMASMHAVGLWHSWSTLTDCVKKGTSVRQKKGEKRDELATKAFIAAMHKNSSTRAMQVVNMLDLKGVKNVLDLGGGSGAYSIAFTKASPEIRSTVFDLAPVITLTEKYVKEAGLSDRIGLVAGDMSSDSLGSGYDLVWVSAICHMWGDDENRDLFGRIYQALNPGGRIVIQDFILDDTGTAPKMGAIFALNMLVNTRAGSSYRNDEYIKWLTSTGYSSVDTVKLPGPTDLIVGTKPK